ncbi:MAG: isochorismatase family protein [Elusimicrobiota bacterium]|jgi:23S rRNA (adenine2503-C2)-methyltransferase
MNIIERREVPGLAVLYLGEAGGDQRRMEFVDTMEPGVPKSEKWVMMISTQLGCAVGCRMCDAGAAGYKGNLTVDEMLAQVRFMVVQNPDLDIRRHPKVKVHFARMGEPALNPDVPEAMAALAQEFPNPGLIASVSTVAPKSPAVAPFFTQMRQVKDKFYPGGRFQLQFSLHATDEATRSLIVPIKKWSFAEVAEYGRQFVRAGDRKITLNFAPSEGQRLDPAVIAQEFDPKLFLIKITPINPTLSADRSGSTHVWHQAPTGIQECSRALEQRGFKVILSPSFQEEIDSETSCGQLWSQGMKTAAQSILRAADKEADSYVSVDSLPAKAEAWMREIGRIRPRGPGFQLGKSGLLIVDMQEFFLDRGSPAYLPAARAILRNVRRLAEVFRQAGRPVLFSAHAQADTDKDGGLMLQWWDKVCRAASPWAQVSGILEPKAADVYRKTGYNVFSNPEVQKRILKEGVSQLVVVGVKTDLCVESTVRAAFDLGVSTFVPADAVAGNTEEQHLSALKAMARGFSRVVLADDVLAGR